MFYSGSLRILDILIVFTLIMSDTLGLVLEISVIWLGLLNIILLCLHGYFHWLQYDGTSIVLSEQRVKGFNKLETIYVD